MRPKTRSERSRLSSTRSARTPIADEEAAKKFLTTITRPEARDLIFGAVMGAAMTDTIEGHESTILDWVAKEWKLEVKYEEPPEA